MSITVRPVDLEAESQELLSTLQANLPALPHARRFQWLYLNNPDGPARSWFACDGAGQVIGVTSLFPRSVWIGDKLRMCGQVGDFAVASGHRSLGPALMMQRATFGPVDEGSLSFCYDCPPHEAGMATFRRLGIPSHCALERYALPLRVDAFLNRRFGFTPPLLPAVGNGLLRLMRPSLPRPAGLDISEHTGLFEDEFSQLDCAVKVADSVRRQRSAAYLNWRYRQHPLLQYRVFTARRSGELIAYVVFCVTNTNVTIVDLFGKDLAEVAPALLEAVVQGCGSSCQIAEIFLPENSELSPPVLKVRFRRRSVAAQVVAYTKPGSEMSVFLERRPRWVFQAADIQG
jgi:hypothetical protein